MISWPKHGFGICCLRFTNRVASAHARLTSGWLAHLCREGVRTLWTATKGFHFLLHHFPLSKAYPDASWAHVRRKFYELQVAHASPLAAEALKRIAELYAIEGEIRGRPPDERLSIRNTAGSTLTGSTPSLVRDYTWPPSRASRRSQSPSAMPWGDGMPCCATVEDGRIEIDNNAAERALRAVALGRKNYLFAGSDSGGERAAAIYSVIGTAKLNGLDPEAYLREVLQRIAEHPINRIEELLPWSISASLQPVIGPDA